MYGDLLAAARNEAKKFINGGGFTIDIVLKTPDGGITLNTKGWGTKHHIAFDSDGLTVNTKNVHICIDEDELIAAGYPARIPDGEVFLKDHLVSFADNTGTVRNYIVLENYPNETLGLIVCILGDHNPA